MGIVSRAQTNASNKIERRGLMDALDASQSLVWFDVSAVSTYETELRI